MKNLLYIGNNLKTKQSNISSIQMLGSLFESEGYTLFYASSKHNKILRLVDMVYSFLKYQNKIDYVLIDTYSTQNFYYALIISQLCRVFKKPYIPNLNGGNLSKRLDKYPLFSSFIFKYAFVNIAPSKFLQEIFEESGYTNVKYIPNTLKIKKYNFRKINNKKINLLWVRSFSKIYNPKLALHLLKNLIDKGYNAQLCMVGPDTDGSLRSIKKLMVKLKVKVKFTGKLDKRDWINLSKDYSFFLNTTNIDNTPVSVIEAMALGLPVVSTNVGGMPYLIEDSLTGLLVQPNDVEAMTEALIKLISKPQLASMIAKNARKKVEHFDWNIVKHQWFKVFC